MAFAPEPALIQLVIFFFRCCRIYSGQAIERTREAIDRQKDGQGIHKILSAIAHGHIARRMAPGLGIAAA